MNVRDMIRNRREFLARYCAAAIAATVITVLSVALANSQTREEPPTQAVETEALEMTGYRPSPVSVETRGLAMIGFRPGPVMVETSALRMTGYRRGPVSVGTDALRMTGYGRAPVDLETHVLRMTGYRIEGVTVDTGPLQMTGYGDDDRPSGRDPPPEPVAVDTDALRMTGYRQGPASVNTDALRLTGYRRGPAKVDTDALQMTGYHSNPLTLETDALRMTGYRQGAASVDSDGLRMTGYRSDPATVDAAALRMTGYASRPGKVASADLEITKAAPVSCEAGSLCPFRFLIRNVGSAPYEVMPSVLDEPSGSIAGIGAVGSSANGWKCLPTAAGPVQCLAPLITLAPGATFEASVELRLSPDLRNGTRFENCVRLAPQAPGANAIRFVQFVLSVLGIDPGPIDGQSGPKTRAAVAAFQTTRGLDASGEADALTLRALAALAPADGNAANDRACVSVGITKTIVCGFGERPVGETCHPICTERNAHYDGSRCVVCGNGYIWNAASLSCAPSIQTQPSPAPSTTRPRPRLIPPPTRDPQVIVTCTGGSVRGLQCICPPRWIRQTVRIVKTARIYNCVPPR